MATEFSSRQVLRTILENNKPEIVQQLNSSGQFLSRLAKADLIDPGGVSYYERIRNRDERNREVVVEVMGRASSVENGYSKLLEALRHTNQSHLAAILTNVDKEIDMVDQYQNQLAGHLRTVDSYLVTESRRAEVRLPNQDQDLSSDQMPHSKTMKPIQGITDREEMTEFLYRVHQTTKSTLQQFDRCREVIDKLHGDCDKVARKNAETLSKLRECEHLVSSLMPALGLEPAIPERVEPSSRPNSPSGQTTRSPRRTEPEAIATAVRKNLNSVADELLLKDEGRKRNAAILNNVLKDIHDRRLALSRHTDLLPKDGKANKYLTGLPTLSRQPARLDPLHYKVEELAEQAFAYVQQETQLSHKMALVNLQSGSSHRNFDQVDKELVHLQKELRRNDKERALLFAANIIQSTKGEREDCIHMVDEMSRTVRTRRLRLQDAATRSITRLRRRPGRKVKATQAVESNFAKRLNDLNNEVKLYMDLELDQGQRFQADLLKKRQEFEVKFRQQQSEGRELDKRLRQSHNERDKYKKLYEQEKAINNAKKAQARTQSRNLAAASERRGILKKHHLQHHLQLEQQRQADTGASTEGRPRRTVRPKLTPRAKDVMALRTGVRKEARVRPMQLIGEDEPKQQHHQQQQPQQQKQQQKPELQRVGKQIEASSNRQGAPITADRNGGDVV